MNNPGYVELAQAITELKTDEVLCTRLIARTVQKQDTARGHLVPAVSKR
jgi:hypothetical protein